MRVSSQGSAAYYQSMLLQSNKMEMLAVDLEEQSDILSMEDKLHIKWPYGK